jgi:staphylococcal nuclease domain-containing protein 1
MVEERDTTGGKVKGQGTGAIIAVTLVAVDAEISVNAAMLQVFIATDSYLKCFQNYVA